MRRHPLALLAASLLAGGARGDIGEAVPKPELQLLSEAVRYVKREFARAVDDAVLASGCADAVAALSGTAERAASGLEAIPPLLVRAKAAAPPDVGYRRLVHSCIEGMISMLDAHSQFMSEIEFRSLYRGGHAKGETMRLSKVRVWWGEGDVLQLRIARFTDGTRNELLRELARLADGATREPRGIVLDLRDNAGGTLLAAVDTSGVFLEDGLEVGATRGRGQKLIASYRANERDRVSYYGPAVPMQLTRALKRAPLAVLVNERTASGAEILAAALRGNGRAQLVGARTLGMGSVQTLFPLAGGAALKVTTAFWHAPKDVPLDGRPLDPDLAAGDEATMHEALRWLSEAGARK